MDAIWIDMDGYYGIEVDPGKGLTVYSECCLDTLMDVEALTKLRDAIDRYIEANK